MKETHEELLLCIIQILQFFGHHIMFAIFVRMHACKEKIPKTLVKFPVFSLILRLRGLSILVQDVTELLEEKNALEVFELSLRKTLKDSACQNEIERFLSFEESMIEASCSFETANSTLPEIFNNFLLKIPPLRPDDFPR